MDIQKIAEGMYRLPIPIPFPMKCVYCYLIRDKQGWSIIDAGIEHPEAIEAWQHAMKRLGIEWKSVHSIYITHFHPDHFGLAAWLQERTGAPVYMSPQEIELVRRVWSADSRQAEAIGEMCREHGTPDDLSRQITRKMQTLSKHVSIPSLTPLEKQTIWLGDREWRVLMTPGHSDGHTCFHEPESRLLMAGDHILHRITPNIGSWPHGKPNPLKLYFQSLCLVKELDLSAAYTAHNIILEHVSQRIDEIVEHHKKRLSDMLELALPGKTAYEVASAIFRHKELNAHQWRFAIAETLSHLLYLQEEGLLSAVKRNGKTYFGQF